QFSLERVNKAPASFDPKKLFAFQEHYMQQVPPESKAELALSYLQKAGFAHTPATPEEKARLTEVVRAAADRIKVAGDILDFSDFFVPDDKLPYDEKALDKRIRKPAEAAPLLRKFRERLAAATEFDAVSLER